ncbi:hypothetical protein HK097_007422 [Rhizophlyctis rosea]|uniref:Uncharacterized protein n=1 Tax=Rhizophlyctis rosea TaxID=64517 RepID=A0AAD5X5W8_9FUNG|nr:hypothetical protein HK097_007422 [Rhizophlyctis rosea]
MPILSLVNPTTYHPHTRTSLLFALGGATVPLILGLYFSSDLTTTLPPALPLTPSLELPSYPFRTRPLTLKEKLLHVWNSVKVGGKMFILPCAVGSGVVAFLFWRPVGRGVRSLISYISTLPLRNQIAALPQSVVEVAKDVPGAVMEVVQSVPETVSTLPSTLTTAASTALDVATHLPEVVGDVSIPLPKQPLTPTLLTTSQAITGTLLSAIAFPLNVGLIGFQSAMNTPALLDGKEVPKSTAVAVPEACEAFVTGVKMGWYLPGRVWKNVYVGCLVWGGVVGVLAVRVRRV